MGWVIPSVLWRKGLISEAARAGKSPQHLPPAPGKRKAQEASWGAIVTAAKTIWAKPPYLTYAEMIQQLKSMPHLKAAALSNSAMGR